MARLNINRNIDLWWLGWMLAVVVVGMVGYKLSWTTSDIWRNFGYYQQWLRATEKGDYAGATKIAKRLGENAIPEYIELENLESKENKTVGEWLRIAWLAKRLGQVEKATEAIRKAWELDPIRPDVEKLYFESIRK